MNDARVLVYTSVQSIRWGDMDALGHVNNTLFFRYMEQARSEWLHEHVEGGGHDPGQGTVLVNASCEFLAPLVYPCTIEVRMFLGDLGRSSLISFYEIWVGTTKYADGAAKIVWIDVAAGRATPVPERIASLLRKAPA